MARVRVDLPNITLSGQTTSYYLDAIYIAPVGQAKRAVLGGRVASSPSGSPTVHIITATSRGATNTDWYQAGNTGTLTTTGAISATADALHDYVRIKISAAGTYSIDLADLALFLETE